MKTALITTTIHVPDVLALYRKYDDDVRFFIAGDIKSPHSEIELLCKLIGNARYIHPADQARWKCSEPIGWNCIQRRNIALLEAVEWGADIIYSSDDDNVPVSEDHWCEIKELFDRDDRFMKRCPTSGPMISGCQGWFDPGQLLVPPTRQRGFPHNNSATTAFLWTLKGVVAARIGVVAGTCLGDPDCAASTRIERHPEVHNTSELLRSGVIVDNQTWTIFNSQNTAFIRDLAPAMFMLPGVGRYDDIYASLICQRVMRERDLHVHLGKPFVWQQRNAHNLVADLRQEIDGMGNVMKFARHLTIRNLHRTYSGPPQVTFSALDQVADLWAGLSAWPDLMTQRTVEAAQAFLEDMKVVL